jgi:hypothetical protein
VEVLKRLIDAVRRKGRRRVVERSLIDSSPWERFGSFFASSVAVFSRKRHLGHRSSAVLSWLGSSRLLAVSETQECAERKTFLGRWH